MMTSLDELHQLLKERDERIEELIIENESKKAAMEELFSELEHLSEILEMKANETTQLQIEVERLRKILLASGSSTQTTEQTTLVATPLGSSADLSTIPGQLPPSTAAVSISEEDARVLSGLDLVANQRIDPLRDLDDSLSLHSTAQDSVELMRSKSSIRSYEQQQQQHKDALPSSSSSSSSSSHHPALTPSRISPLPTFIDTNEKPQQVHVQEDPSSEPLLFPPLESNIGGFETSDEHQRISGVEDEV